MSNNFSELDFATVKQNLITYLKNRQDPNDPSKKQFADAEFEGSGWSYLLDLLSYNIVYNGYYLNMVSNEMFLESAILRENVISKAKALSYIPRSKKSAKVTVTLTINTSTSATSVTIPKYTRFTTEHNGVVYNFYTRDSYVVTGTGQTFEQAGVELTEGDLLIHKFTVTDVDTQKFVIPNAEIDTDTITVKVFDSITDLSETVYILHSNIVEMNSESEVYYLQKTADGLWEVYFGDNIISKKLTNGNIVQIEYQLSSGSDANYIRSFSVPSQINFPVIPTSSTVSSASMVVTSIASGGIEEESTESIKRYAPINWEAQNRLVTQSDYEYLVPRMYTNVESCRVWGGEDNVIKQFGKIFIAIKPTVGMYLSAAVKLDIIRTLKTKSVMSHDIVIVDPYYTNLILNVNVKYDNKKTVRPRSEIATAVHDYIISYADTQIEQFGTFLNYSELLENINNLDDSIISNIIHISCRTRVYPKLRIKNYTEINTNNSINTHTSGKAFISNAFYFDGVLCKIAEKSRESRILSIFEFINNSLSTEIKEIGTIDYAKGNAVLYNFEPQAWYQGSSWLDFYSTPISLEFQSKNNQILSINSSEVAVTVNEHTR